MSPPTPTSRVDLLLVGRRLPDNENLGIGHLLAAAGRAGLHAEMLVLNGWEEVADVALGILAADPPLLGLAFPDGNSAVLPLTLGQLLRDAGYRGHITAGGPFATLARAWLLERHAFIDSVVRYAGEAPLVALARALAAGRPLAEVGGLTTRVDGRVSDGLPAPVLDPAQLDLVPARDELPRLLGHAMAQMTASRGCPGRCAYCGPASLQEGELGEGRAAGHSAFELRAVGVGAVRRRPLDALCDEVAALWHERGVRYVYFVDEHVLPRREELALRWIAELREGLARRGVGPLGMGCMLRADLLGEATIEAFVAAGLVRCFLGIELASPAELSRYRRGGRMDRALAAMRALDRRGVAVSCNLMLVHPDATVASIADAIGFARAFDAVSFEAAQMHVYHGTALHERMEAEGRLLGNPLQYAYTFADEAVERFADLLNRLRLDAFGDYSLTCRLHDAALSLSLGERLLPRTRTSDLRAALLELSRSANRLRIGACEEALGLAVDGFGEEQAGALVERARGAATPLAREVDRLAEQVLARFERPRGRFTPLRAAAVPLVTVCLAGAVACHPASPEPPGPRVDIAPPTAASTESAAPATSAAPAPSASAEPPEPVAVAPCSDERAAELEAAVRALVEREAPCKATVLKFSSDAGSRAEYAPDAVRAALAAELDADDRACLDQHEVMVSRNGNDADRARLISALEACRGRGSSWGNVQIQVDIGANGKLSRVDSVPPGSLPPALRACIVKVLLGLRFPCYANTSQYPWPRQMVIME